jgi:psp operon transcriptional activator
MSTPVSEPTTIIGEAPAFIDMLERVSRAAPLAKPVLVVGERGTGKELIAARLHYLSPRWEQPLVKLNCSVLTESILESELFGHEAGAFTGAARRHTGRFERADGGTLLLDELATIPMRMQEKILRVTEYGEFERVGGAETIRVDVRIVGATNADLPARVAEGQFRADLLDRLAFDVIAVPPLRRRQEDILPLAEHFAFNIVRELGRDYFPGFTARCQQELLGYAWPGNVRSLKNAIERSVYRSNDPEAPIDIVVYDPFESSFSESTPEPVATRSDLPAASSLQSSTVSANLKDAVANLEQRLIDQAMRSSRYRQRQAAELLGLSYHQLRGLLRKHDLIEKYGRRRQSNG